jgi:hypothetical protein
MPWPSRKICPRALADALGNVSDGFAVVEAVFVFPIMLMVLLALVMLAIYLPQHAMLQRAASMAATALATESGDTWVYFDKDTLTYKRHNDYSGLGGWVYNWGFPSGAANNATDMVKKLDQKENLPLIASVDLKVECRLYNYVVYKEVEVTATRSIKIPVDFSVIRFPTTLDLTVTAKAVVKDGDEFVRNIDLGISFLDWLGGSLDDMKNAFSNGDVIDLLF